MSTPSLYPYQQEVFDHLLNGRNVILQAPTGAGKTHAALLPFLEALTQPGRTIAFPQKCIYAVPMRILANQFVTKYAPLFAKQKVNGWAPDLPAIAQQTGEHPDDPEFAARLTFATIDQVLSSFLVASYGLSSRQANINAGAVIASYLVLDEFHLFDPTSTLPTALEMLRLLRGLTPFTLMTATFSTGMLQRLATLLDAVIVGGTGYADQWRALPSQQKQRRYHTVDAPLSAARILEVHQSLATKRSLAICNRVERAQGLFAALRQAAPPDTELYLLHSRFLPEDRARIEAHITQYFSQNADKRGSVIVVATQAIEVGLDITSAALHTELAPANAIIQRAGRCARYKGEEGDVYLYRQSTAPDGSIANLFEDMSPYARRPANPTADGAAEDDNPHDNASENGLKRTMIEKTWEAFCARQGVLDYADELAIIDHAHQDLDQFTLDKLEAEQWAHQGTMFEAMNGGTEQVPGLVRDSNNRRVIIHNDPNALMTSGVVEATGPHTASEKKERTVSPYSLSAFNLYDGTARGFVKQWLERPLDEEPPHRLWALQEVEDPESQQRSYVWKHVTDASQVKSSALVCVSPMLAGYDPECGFLPDEGNGWMTPPAPETAKRGDFGNYALETYAAHIERVYAELVEATFPEIAAAASKLELQMGLRAGSMYLAARLAAVLHDTGKLSVGWQRFVHEWQQEIGEMADLDPHQAYAHTDNYTADHRKREKEFRKKVKRPNHAVEGAAATFYLMFGHLLGFQPTASKANGHNLVIAVYSAISRHHSPQVRGDFKPFNFVQKADSHTRQVMRDHMPELPDNAITLSTDEQQKQLATSASLKLDMNTKTYRTYFAYLLLVRALRRADQRGTRRGTRGK